MVDFNALHKLTVNLSVLYVEDDVNFKEETCDVLDALFGKVDIADDGQEGIDKYKEYFEKTGKYYDIVISDINMPKLNGVELTKEIYKVNCEQVIIIISAHNEADHLLEFVNLGIEHFLVKPLDLDKTMGVFEKTAQKILKIRSTNNEFSATVDLPNGYTWDKKESLLFKGDKLIKLTYKEMLLMQLFIKNGAKISSHDEIFNTLWDDIFLANNHSLKCIVSRLRKKLPEQEIENISKVGYKLVF